MKLMKTISFIFLLLGLGISLQANSEMTKIILAFENKESSPNYLGNGKNINWERPGFSVEYLKLLESKLKIEIKFVRLPWRRALKELKENNIDGLFNASYKKDREQFGNYPLLPNGDISVNNRITSMNYVFFKNKSSNIQWDGDKLSNFTGEVGVVNGYSIGDDLIKDGYSISNAIGPESLLQMLLRKRFLLIAASDTQLNNIIRISKEAYKDIEQLKIPYSTKPYYLMLSKEFVQKHPILSNKIWNKIGELRDGLLISFIRKKYELVD